MRRLRLPSGHCCDELSATAGKETVRLRRHVRHLAAEGGAPGAALSATVRRAVAEAASTGEVTTLDRLADIALPFLSRQSGWQQRGGRVRSTPYALVLCWAVTVAAEVAGATAAWAVDLQACRADAMQACIADAAAEPPVYTASPPASTVKAPVGAIEECTVARAVATAAEFAAEPPARLASRVARTAAGPVWPAARPASRVGRPAWQAAEPAGPAAGATATVPGAATADGTAAAASLCYMQEEPGNGTVVELEASNRWLNRSRLHTLFLSGPSYRGPLVNLNRRRASAQEGDGGRPFIARPW